MVYRPSSEKIIIYFKLQNTGSIAGPERKGILADRR